MTRYVDGRIPFEEPTVGDEAERWMYGRPSVTPRPAGWPQPSRWQRASTTLAIAAVFAGTVIVSAAGCWTIGRLIWQTVR